MVKLMYITNGFTGAGGLERVLSIKASYLADHFGYEVTILSLNEQDVAPFYEFSSKIKLISIAVNGNPLKYITLYKSGLQNAINFLKPDIISVCDDGLKGFFLPKLIRTEAKWIYERHVSKLIDARSGQGIIKNLLTQSKWNLMEKLGKNFSSFVVLTEGNKKEWKSLQNIIVIPNPLSFYPEESSPLDQKKVICVGKICYQKGQDLLVEVWKKVNKLHPDWKLELYGKTNEEFLNTKNLSILNIHHFPPERNIKQRYLDSSIYVMSSRFEGFGMVLIEAMACGVPCVSFNCANGPSDIITNKEDGILVDENNTSELAESLIKLIISEPLRKKMGVKAKQNVKRFKPNIIISHWDQLFRSL